METWLQYWLLIGGYKVPDDTHGVFTDSPVLGNGELCRLDLVEQFLRSAVIKGELTYKDDNNYNSSKLTIQQILTIQHCEHDHPQGPHVTGFALVRFV